MTAAHTTSVSITTLITSFFGAGRFHKNCVSTVLHAKKKSNFVFFHIMDHKSSTIYCMAMMNVPYEISKHAQYVYCYTKTQILTPNTEGKFSAMYFSKGEYSARQSDQRIACKWNHLQVIISISLRIPQQCMANQLTDGLLQWCTMGTNIHVSSAIIVSSHRTNQRHSHALYTTTAIFFFL